MRGEHDNSEFISFEGDPTFYRRQFTALGSIAVGITVLEVTPFFGANEIVAESAAGIALAVAFEGFRRLLRWLHEPGS